ncbi:sodium:solute symporter family protein [Acidiphilium sp. AL]|uniref:Sodium:solute symporter family protein n=1 Tax=Acidiphilium iwatense TaxID=768198 RepID=A0ABS9DVY5_9PROT|nr:MULTISPECIES: sodium:solute symporter family protein [Acidiphilium]MCF3946888.1 sodium:solute symporter family protein [Acidiphilium iwatense]MCU4159805.1 sodium:solute symporter family protein [Acidiphilium sp. AL]
MATAVFGLLILFSLIVAFAAKRGHNVRDLHEYFIASRQFGSYLLFFLAAGEIYSIGTMIGFPGGIYANGPTYGIWFLGYILLAYPVGYFLNPWIWRAGQVYDAVTLPDLFKGHFNSRALELTVTITAIIFLIPWGELQFTGLIVALNGLGWHFDPLVLSLIAAGLAFAYIAASGIRAPAMVSIVKDTLLVLALIVTGVAAASATGLAHVFQAASTHVHNHMTPTGERFAISTIVFQALGFYMFPFAIPNIFTARNEQTIRRTQIFMPLYMLMYPFLVVAAYYALDQHFKLASPNDAFMAAAVNLLPGWLLGLVAAGASLSGLVVLAGLSLAIGPLVSRNLLPHLSEQRQRSGAQIVIVVYLALSILFTLATPSLMLTLINTAYFGITQFLPGILAIIFFRRVDARAVMAGIIVADALAIGLYLMNVSLDGWNLGFACLLLNIAIVVLGSIPARRRTDLIPVAERMPQ